MPGPSEARPLAGVPLPVRDTRESPAGAAVGAAMADDPGAPLEQRVVAALRTIRDPEIPVNIYDLGLIYELAVSAAGDVQVRMTLTSPACPVAQSLPTEVERRLRALTGVGAVHVELAWDPPWSRDRLSEAAKLQLGLL